MSDECQQVVADKVVVVGEKRSRSPTNQSVKPTTSTRPPRIIDSVLQWRIDWSPGKSAKEFLTNDPKKEPQSTLNTIQRKINTANNGNAKWSAVMGDFHNPPEDTESQYVKEAFSNGLSFDVIAIHSSWRMPIAFSKAKKHVWILKVFPVDHPKSEEMATADHYATIVESIEV